MKREPLFKPRKTDRRNVERRAKTKRRRVERIEQAEKEDASIRDAIEKAVKTPRTWKVKDRRGTTVLKLKAEWQKPEAWFGAGKPTNPKDAIASDRISLGLFPDSAVLLGSLGMFEGLLKYGAHNYRACGALASVYIHACRRHLASWWNGEEVDPETNVPHLGSALASLAILIDAHLCGALVDDRPPIVPLAKQIRDAREVVKHLKKLFADRNPRHYTFADPVYVAPKPKRKE